MLHSRFYSSKHDETTVWPLGAGVMAKLEAGQRTSCNLFVITGTMGSLWHLQQLAIDDPILLRLMRKVNR